MNIQLETRDGGLVATKSILPFKLLPEVMSWGARYFVLFHNPGDGTPIYREAFCFPIIETETETKLTPVPAGLTTDPGDADLNELEPSGQQKKYLILSAEERAKGFVQPVRQKYIHLACGTMTHMGLALAETYARDPKFYSGTFCCACNSHFPLVIEGKPQFQWDTPETGFVGE